MIFDKNVDGNLAYTKKQHIVEIEYYTLKVMQLEENSSILLEHCPHEIVTQAVVCDLLIQDDVCYGVQYFTSEHEQKVAFAHNTIIASGGVGSLYKYHTNSTANAGEIQGIIAEKIYL